jgi:hypothetical protein
MTSKSNNTFQMQAFAKQLELLTGVTKDMKDEMVLMRQQDNVMNRLRMGADRRRSPIWRAMWNVKIDQQTF